FTCPLTDKALSCEHLIAYSVTRKRTNPFPRIQNCNFIYLSNVKLIRPDRIKKVMSVKNKSLLFLAAVLLLFGCLQSQKNYVLKVKPRHLDKERMFDQALAYDVIFDANEFSNDSLKNESRL